MIEELIARQREMNIFKKLLKSQRPEFLAVYGRRRIGKTFLIRKYFENKLVFDFSGAFQAEMDMQLDNFFAEYLHWTKAQRETVPPRNWSDAFRYLSEFLHSLKTRKRKIVVFIDELPWLDTPKSNFITALEYFWNQHGSKMNNLLFVTCGSSASWMRNKLILAKGGLYNRVTKRIKLLPFNLYETELYCKKKKLNLSQFQITILYMIMGGIPFYLNELSRGKSATQLINEICFQETGLLYDEYEQLYYSLFKNAEDHILLIEALAKKPKGLLRSELVKATGLPDGGSFTRILNELEDSDFIKGYREFGKKKKGTTYKLIDYYSQFYIKFIRPNKKSNKSKWIQLEKSSSFIAWRGLTFETICMNHIPQLQNALGISGVQSDATTWQYKATDEIPGAQIDLVIDRADRIINLCEAKFTDEPLIITNNYAKDLSKKRSVFNTVTKTRKSTNTVLITSYPAIKNKYYHDEIENEITLDYLFKKTRVL